MRFYATKMACTPEHVSANILLSKKENSDRLQARSGNHLGAERGDALLRRSDSRRCAEL